MGPNLQPRDVSNKDGASSIPTQSNNGGIADERVTMGGYDRVESFLRWLCADTQLRWLGSKMDAVVAQSSLCDAQLSQTHLQSLPICDSATKHAHLHKQCSVCDILPDLSVLDENVLIYISMTVHLLISIVYNLYNLVGSVIYNRVYTFCVEIAGTTTSAMREQHPRAQYMLSDTVECRMLMLLACCTKSTCNDKRRNHSLRLACTRLGPDDHPGGSLLALVLQFWLMTFIQFPITRLAHDVDDVRQVELLELGLYFR